MKSCLAKLHAGTEFEKYRVIQDRLFESDFDRFLAVEHQTKAADMPGRQTKPKGGKKAV